MSRMKESFVLLRKNIKNNPFLSMVYNVLRLDVCIIIMILKLHVSQEQ